MSDERSWIEWKNGCKRELEIRENGKLKSKKKGKFK